MVAVVEVDHSCDDDEDHTVLVAVIRYDNPEVLKRLDVRLFEASPGDSGWEVSCSVC